MIDAQVPSLLTKRLTMRAFDGSDSEDVQSLLHEPEIAANTTNIPYPYPEGAAAEWIGRQAESLRDGAEVVWAIVHTSDCVLMGAIGLHIDQRHQRGVLGYWIGVPFWNHGYMTEAAAAVVDCGFNEFGLHRIEATCFPWNPASARIMVKIGMQYEGTMRGYIQKNDEFTDLQLYALLRSDGAAEH